MFLLSKINVTNATVHTTVMDHPRILKQFPSVSYLLCLWDCHDCLVRYACVLVWWRLIYGYKHYQTCVLQL
jgi:hypothetical protein